MYMYIVSSSWGWTTHTLITQIRNGLHILKHFGIFQYFNIIIHAPHAHTASPYINIEKNVGVVLNNCIKHKKFNFIKGILACDMNVSYLENDNIILDYHDKDSIIIKLKLLLKNIENYFWLFWL